ncbi:hypothetical protein A3742_04650 [Oleiphilus sp. HI0071]|nr:MULTISPECIES: lactate utilization protein [unclassified Oleiphilus]KZY63750.1 hypothetical protein A3737_03440 [Oleiphilus sp. HI0065]KZY81927.1 hypothetical protein A3742_19030 [Oleiphilus sp. HI0071]KZY92405.1 hypothetical protein A3744_19160 [Oleiphilus sp. HI0073]KZZ50734.1 hypothetical protein A3760_19720 [Oleiphilus sp. HI0122]KZZ51516.1 hypothetical protein A3758_11905 [Oleiphilus sp. HI0118]KZZ70740.1 hypothetical protein A3765_02870 [Oleiphilus sp. HI0130]
MTDSAKQHILGNLRRAKAKSASQRGSTIPDNTARQPDIALFKQLLRQNHAEVHEVTEEHLGTSIDEWLNTEQLKGAVAVAEHPDLTDLKLQLTDDLSLVDIGALDKTVLFDTVTLSICFADGGVADKGALIVKANAQQPRSLSLVPPISILVIKKHTILDSLTSAFDSSLFDPQTLPSNLVFISGPSKTADIQQTLAYGAHGPKRLIVFLLT